MSDWLDRLRANPVAPLLASDQPALVWCARHDLLGEPGDPQTLWELPAVRAAVRRQRDDGSWHYSGGSREIRPQTHYDQLASYEALLPLVYQFRLDARHPALGAAAQFLLGFQTEDGDIRGLYGTQYTPNYTAAMLAALIDAGYLDDPRVEMGLRWLVSIRQDDGGWTVPWRTRSPRYAANFKAAMRLPRPLEPDRSKPSSHLITGVVLRALAAHPEYRSRPEAAAAAELLASRFFRADKYPDRRAAGYWEKLYFPFRWTDLGSALDSITRVGIAPENPHVDAALRWLVERQGADGLWRSGYPKARDRSIHHWVSYAVVRVLSRAAAA